MDKQIMLSSNMISMVYIAVNLACCNNCNFLYALVYNSSFLSRLAMSIKERTMNTEQRIKLKFLFSVDENSITSA